MPHRRLPAVAALLALVAMLAAPLSTLLCCRALGVGLRHHEHAHGHHHAGQLRHHRTGDHPGDRLARTEASPQGNRPPAGPAVGQPSDGGCPVVSLPPARLVTDPTGIAALPQTGSAAAPCAAEGAPTVPAHLLPDPKPAGRLALAARAPPWPARPIYLHTRALLI